MKKLIIVISAALVLGACSQSAGDKFVGTWSGTGVSNETVKWVITKNNGGSSYTVTDPKQHSFAGILDGDTLIIDAGIMGKIPVKIEDKMLIINGGKLIKQN